MLDGHGRTGALGVKAAPLFDSLRRHIKIDNVGVCLEVTMRPDGLPGILSFGPEHEMAGDNGGCGTLLPDFSDGDLTPRRLGVFRGLFERLEASWDQ